MGLFCRWAYSRMACRQAPHGETGWRFVSPAAHGDAHDAFSGMQGRSVVNGDPFGAQARRRCGVFLVVARNDRPVFQFDGCPYQKVRIGGVGVFPGAGGSLQKGEFLGREVLLAEVVGIGKGEVLLFFHRWWGFMAAR